MVIISAARIVEARVDKVWEIVSDVDRDQEYWIGLGSIRNLRRGVNVVEREVTVGFIGRTSTQRIELKPKESVELKMTRGPLKGNREITLTPLGGGERTMVDVSWNFEFSGVPAFAHEFVRSQVERATKAALTMIEAAAKEGNQTLVGRANGGKRRPKPSPAGA
jgi:ribosome-associated toxin RatA of RatAB toxin-antitoxin module